jgi:vancomycin resistance protein VanW
MEALVRYPPMIKRPKWLPRPLSMMHPSLHRVATALRQLERSVEWVTDEHDYRLLSTQDSLAFRVKKHQSVLIRSHADVDLRLQKNKVVNVRIAARSLHGIVIAPGQTLSFCRLVGKPTQRRGFIEGMELVRGVAQAGIGGGICQISNLIYWLALHTPLEIIERHHHSFDPFPDSGRILPFASGATVMFNYRDLRIRNNTAQPFQLRLWLDDKCLNGEMRTTHLLPRSYHVLERNSRFSKHGDIWFRTNELWRTILERSSGRTIGEEFIVRNHAEVKYVPVGNNADSCQQKME